MKKSKGLKKAIKVIGSQLKLAKALNKTQSTVCDWVHKYGPAPEYCYQIQELTGVPVWELRPDVFGFLKPAKEGKQYEPR